MLSGGFRHRAASHQRDLTGGGGGNARGGSSEGGSRVRSSGGGVGKKKDNRMGARERVTSFRAQSEKVLIKIY